MRLVVRKPELLQIKMPVTSEYQALSAFKEDYCYFHVYNSFGFQVVVAIAYIFPTYILSTTINIMELPCGEYRAYFSLPASYPEEGIQLFICQGVVKDAKETTTV